MYTFIHASSHEQDLCRYLGMVYLADTRDHHHLVAQLANEELLDQAYSFITTNLVLAETLTLLRYNISHAAAVQLVSTTLLEYPTVSVALPTDH